MKNAKIKGRTLKKENGIGQQSSKSVYTVADIAEILGISRNSAYRLVKQGCFVCKRIGTDIRISKASFDNWLNSDKGEDATELTCEKGAV